jgi:hypothetical protein
MKTYHITIYYSRFSKEPINLRNKKLSINHIIDEHFVKCNEEDFERYCLTAMRDICDCLPLYKEYEQRIKAKVIELIAKELPVIEGITLLNKPIIHGLTSTISIKQIKFKYNGLNAQRIINNNQTTAQ